MKKVLVVMLTLAAVAVLFSAPLQAQNSMSFGPKAGLNLANVYGDDVINNDAKLGFCGGAFLAADVSPSITVQPELLYVMRGAKVSGTDVKLKVDYITLPVLFKWRIPTQGSVSPNLFLGGEPAFLMSAKVTNGGSVDVKDSTKSFDFGVIFGGGIDFAAGQGSVMLDVRYTLGLISGDDSVAKEDIKNSSFSFMLGYAIPIGSKPTP